MIDEDGSGEVTFDEFVNEVAGDEDVWNCFQVTFLALSLIALMLSFPSLCVCSYLHSVFAFVFELI